VFVILPLVTIGVILPSTRMRAQEHQGQGTHMKLWRVAIVLAGLMSVAVSGAAQENFPTRPVRIVIPYSPGSVADVFARIVAHNMAMQWAGSIIVESKSGANGSIAAEEVARSAPDGYTWLLVTAFFTASPALDAKLRWDPLRDFIPVGQICRAPNFFIVPATLPVRNVAEYVALAKAKPGTLNYSHPGMGSTGHLGFELFKRLAGIDVTAVGYRGYPQMVPDIASGRITSTFLSANQALAQVQTGAIRIIGTINDGRTKYFPDVPTMAEQGFAEAQVTPWFGIVVPVGTPEPVVDRISTTLETALAAGDVREKLDIAGCEPRSAPRARFADIIKSDVALWAKVVKEAGISMD
jgi:tripartite-type tricarboxylate transporter receptor subunit TctC